MGSMKRKTSSFSFGVAALSVALNADGELQLTPAGKFRGIDGRPADVDAWEIDAAAARDVIAFCSARKNPFVIDYEHQTLLKEKNGQPAPAAGWFSGSDLVWREGEGLFAKVSLTPRAKQYIADDEYKFVSPVIYYNKTTGRVAGLHSAALTNVACIDGMEEALARAAASFLTDSTEQEALNMDLDELLNNIRWMLNLPTLATQEEIAAELQKAVDKIKAANTETAAAGFNLLSLIESRNATIAALTAQAENPDPAKYVPISTMQEMQTQLAALTATVRGKEVGDLVAAALSDGRLLPAQEKWARDLGTKDIAALTAYLETSHPVAALGSTQTGGKSPDGNTAVAALTAEQLQVCTAMGVSPEDFQETLKAQAAQA